MTRRTEPPFRADHVGSLLRPRRLHEARRGLGLIRPPVRPDKELAGSAAF